MKLNHINLTVTDLQAAKNILETYFEMQAYEGDRQNKNFVVLFDNSGFVLTLMKASHSTEVKYPGYFHIGFGQESEERVNEIYQRLKDDGFDVKPPERHHAWTFYFAAPGGFTIEIMA
jgi:lactoylglutathione lyase